MKQDSQKYLRNGKNSKLEQVKDKQEGMVRMQRNIMERWREYIQKLLAEYEKNAGAILEDEEANHLITEQELRVAIKKLEWGKAAGHAKITPEWQKS